MKAQPKYHYKSWRKETGKTLDKMLDQCRYVSIANLEKLPGKANREFKEVLKKLGFVTKVVNVNIAKICLKNKGLDNVLPYAHGSIMLIMGNENPFKMYREIKNNASAASAREGAIALDDIYVPEGDTGIAPGPALTDFKVAKVDTQIRAGKIYISKKTKVCDKGKVIDPKVVVLLNKLGIKPMKIVLDVKGAYDKTDKILYGIEVLNIDLEKLKTNIKDAYLNSYYLAIEQGYITTVTIKPMIAKAYKSAKALAISQNIITKDTIKDLVVKAGRIAETLEKKSNSIN